MQICGLDEVGRGPLAGPIVAAGVILNPKLKITRLKDSKKIGAQLRENLFAEIIKKAELVKTETISVKQINNRGIGWANREVFRRLINQIDAEKYIVDGNLKIRVRGKTGKIKSVVNADDTRKCVMAASIVAKVTRDRMMKELAKKHKKYGWESNSGYGTKQHVQAIKEFGVTIHHRTIFVRTALN